MSDDSRLIALVALVWSVLAAAYALVPALDMPGSALVWGIGAALFWTLAILVARAERRGARGTG